MASNFAYGKSVFLQDVRLQWGDLYRPGDAMEEGGTPKFKVVGLFARDSSAASVAKQAMLEVAGELWGGNAQQVLVNITANSKAVRDGNAKIDDAGNVKPEFKDMLFVSAGNKSKPQIVAPRKHNGQFVFITEEGRGMAGGVDVTDQLGYNLVVPYRGCRVNLKVQFVAGKAFLNAQKKQVPNQVFCRLEAVQFLRDDTAFGAGPTSAEGFGDEEVSQEMVDANTLF